jgi:aspartate 4-decarboxylase
MQRTKEIDMAATDVVPGREVEPGLEHLSPFELKDKLIEYAHDFSQQKSATRSFLNAGRGNPNWVATVPREAFFLLGQFALCESKRVWDEPGLGGMPHAPGCAARLRVFLSNSGPGEGAALLRSIADGSEKLGFDADAFVHELVDSITGDNYPVPDRMLVHTEKVVHRYLAHEIWGEDSPGRRDLFAVEGGTAAMCYVFASLLANFILRKGDTVALGTPIFTPYLELPHLEEFGLRTIDIGQTTMSGGMHTWQYSEAELAKLEDPAVKAFFIVNPSNPASYAMDQQAHRQLVDLVRNKRPDLLILTDDVYGTFVPGFRSLAGSLPRNTILVYSFSKYFGCTGWRLGVVAIHEDNILDEKLKRLSTRDKKALEQRYRSLTPDPGSMKFIDRMVADSRDVALNHTAGLSLPQQAQMALFALYALLDEEDSYKKKCQEIVHRRWSRLVEGLGIAASEDPCRVGYYAQLDLEAWGRRTFGDDFVEFVAQHREPVDVVIQLAKRFGTVLLNGAGFGGPPWSVRVSLANLNDDEYVAIGQHLRALVGNAVDIWRRAGQGGGEGTTQKTPNYPHRNGDRS